MCIRQFWIQPRAAQLLCVSLKSILDDAIHQVKFYAAADAQILGSFTDEAKIDELAAVSDVLTVEIEHINADAYEAAALKAGIPADPSAETVRLIQDKYAQKVHLKQHGVPMGAFQQVENAAVLAALAEVSAALALNLPQADAHTTHIHRSGGTR